MPTFTDSLKRSDPMTRLSLWMAFGLGIFVIVLATWSLMYGHEAVVVWGGVISGLALTLTPFIIGTGAAIMTTRAIERSSEVQPVTYYVFNAMRRFRYLLALVIGLMPLIPIFGLYLILVFPVIFRVVIGEVDTPDHFPVVYPQNVMLRTMAVPGKRKRQQL